ncbi:MAG: hypothetical protein JST70_18255 [Bacteroidetes bacterium]|nr:hypothetical protein [Bacteroidota bacterium]
MTSTERGRFCNSCQKTVIDFTGFTDAQLHAFFSSSKCSNVCGRFYDDQLSRGIAAPAKPRNRVYQWLLQLSASFLLFSSQESSAKTNPPTYTASDTTRQNNKAAIEKEIAAVEAERREIKDIKVERTISLGGASSEGAVYIIDGFAYDKDGNKVKLHRRNLARRILDWLSR